METLLVHADIAARVLPPLCDIYARERRAAGCERSRDRAGHERGPEETGTEYLAPILAVGRRLLTPRSRTSRIRLPAHRRDRDAGSGNAMHFLRKSAPSVGQRVDPFCRRFQYGSARKSAR
jgi:hypothetical protein